MGGKENGGEERSREEDKGEVVIRRDGRRGERIHESKGEERGV